MRRILHSFPLSAVHAVGIAIVSYDGELVSGVHADHAATPTSTWLKPPSTTSSWL
jgi:hypothetical protein